MTPERVRLLEAVAEAAETMERFRCNGWYPWAAWAEFDARGGVAGPLAALRAHDAAPQVVGETVEVEMWELVSTGDVQFCSAGTDASDTYRQLSKAKFRGITRISATVEDVKQ